MGVWASRPNMGWFDLGISTGNPWVFALKSGISMDFLQFVYSNKLKGGVRRDDWCNLSATQNSKGNTSVKWLSNLMQARSPRNLYFRKGTWNPISIAAEYDLTKKLLWLLCLGLGFKVDSTNRYNTILVTLLETYIVKIGPSWRGCWVRLALDKTKQYWGGFPKGYVSKPQPIVEANKSTPRIF